jgi:hypothetical protein
MVPGTKTAISFRVTCHGMAVDALRVDPDREIKTFRRWPRIENRHHPDESMRCRIRRDASGNRLGCGGWVRSGTRVVGRFNVPRAERCDTATRFTMTGGLDCDPDAPCRKVGVMDVVVDPHPHGC